MCSGRRVDGAPGRSCAIRWQVLVLLVLLVLLMLIQAPQDIRRGLLLRRLLLRPLPLTLSHRSVDRAPQFVVGFQPHDLAPECLALARGQLQLGGDRPPAHGVGEASKAPVLVAMAQGDFHQPLPIRPGPARGLPAGQDLAAGLSVLRPPRTYL